MNSHPEKVINELYSNQRLDACKINLAARDHYPGQDMLVDLDTLELKEHQEWISGLEMLKDFPCYIRHTADSSLTTKQEFELMYLPDDFSPDIVTHQDDNFATLYHMPNHNGPCISNYESLAERSKCCDFSQYQRQQKGSNPPTIRGEEATITISPSAQPILHLSHPPIVAKVHQTWPSINDDAHNNSSGHTSSASSPCGLIERQLYHHSCPPDVRLKGIMQPQPLRVVVSQNKVHRTTTQYPSTVFDCCNKYNSNYIRDDYLDRNQQHANSFISSRRVRGNPRNVSFDAIHNTIAVSRSASDCDDESTVPVDNDCVDENGGECSTDGTSLPRRKATEEARKILLTWLVLHQNNPYPNRRQKQDLASLTGMTLKQIVHWMSNIRKRRFMPLLSGRREATSKVDQKFLEEIEQIKRETYEYEALLEDDI